MANDKSTVYVDIDDEVTAIIDKVAGAKSKIVALVLPKRATAVQSLVNMKLIKRAAEDNKKQLVLITSESGLMPLAGAAGLYVAKTLNSKPEIPSAPDHDEMVEAINEDEGPEEESFDARKDEQRPLGEVAGLDGAAVAAKSDDDEPIEFDNSDKKPEAGAPKPKKGKDKKLKIPNFNRFRNRAVIVVLVLIGLGVLAYFALEVWPHATVKIYTKQTSVPLAFTANLDNDANAVQPQDGVLPATAQTEQKSYSQTVPASGQKDEGTRASGTVTMSATKCSGNPFDFPEVPANVGVSTNNLTYITQQTTTFHGTGQNSNGCFTYEADSSTPITAQKPGDNYNVNSGSFTVNYSGATVTASGSASGGTSNMVRVVQESDIKTAKQKLKSQDDDAIQQTLKTELEHNNLVPLAQTFAALPSDVSSSADAGDQANNVTVTENVTYVMFGYKKSDMKQLITAKVSQQISSSQGVLDNGLDEASFKLTDTPSTSSAHVEINTNVTIGPKLDKVKIAEQAAGKKTGEVRDKLVKHAGVAKVKIDLSPFWVGSIPNDPNKVKVEFVKQPDNG